MLINNFFKHNILKNIKYFLANILSRFSKIINGKFSYGILVKCNNYPLIVESTDMGFGGQVRRTGKYGQDEISRIKKLINKDSEVLFIGTHVGGLSIPISFFCSKIHMIESNPDTYEFLKINCRINNIQNCKLYNFGAGEKNDKINFIKNVVNSAGSKREPINKKRIYYYDQPKTIQINIKKLDDFFKEASFDLIFMDIEGSEYFALLGMQKILKNCNSLIIEFIPHHLTNVSGIDINSLVNLIKPHFDFLTIPSLDKFIEKKDFNIELNKMFKNNISDDGIVFTKRIVNK